ncbi:YeeE/YedE family protein [Dyella telluris]|uniref:YeeE/YedE family protein n=1 Tax=Dyella telluris TaxID=2763498 RepID=A0A7G8Q8L3_9GAMM|nr:YeeE/YedE family protein [Dyella telluris]QNK03121.1 YeeE/YedE family protein [Dyella telluris]
MHPWLLSLLGGILIGLAAVWLMAMLGRIAGISGIASSLLRGAGDWPWRAAFVAGLVMSPLCLWLVRGDNGLGAPQVAWPWMALAGLLVGFGTRLGSGCTSGHGVCGIARLSSRSIAATAVFMVLGMLTVAVVRHWLGGLPA